MAEKATTIKVLSDNRQAGHNYFLMDRFEAGMVLTGTEVKAAKDGKIQLTDAYATGSVQGNANVGGLAGAKSTKTGGSIVDSYATGAVSGRSNPSVAVMPSPMTSGGLVMLKRAGSRLACSRSIRLVTSPIP